MTEGYQLAAPYRELKDPIGLWLCGLPEIAYMPSRCRLVSSLCSDSTLWTIGLYSSNGTARNASQKGASFRHVHMV